MGAAAASAHNVPLVLKNVCLCSQVELTGSSIFDYVHTNDHCELAEQLGVTLANHQRISPTSATSMSPDVPEGLSAAVNHGASPAIPDGKPCK